MQKKIVLILTGLMVAVTVIAGEADTLITLQEVSISARRQIDFGAGHNTQILDSIVLQRNSDQDMAYLLSRYAGLFIKSYGPGILASITLRGGQPGQTAMIWNGFNLQSPMNGQIELSLLPAIFADEVLVQYGGGSSLWGSGAIGGAILINNHPVRIPGFSGSLGLNGGSIGDFGQEVKLSYGKPQFSTTIRAFNRNARNQYHFFNPNLPGNPVEIQKQAGIEQNGILHDTWFRLGDAHQFEMRWWWQNSERDIPPALDMRDYQSKQKDHSFRFTAQYLLSLPKSLIIVRGANFEDRLDFSDNFDYEGNSTSRILSGEAEVRWKPEKHLAFNGGVNIQGVSANALEYEEEKHRNSIAVFASGKWEPLDKNLELAVSARKEFVKGRDIPFAPSLGIAWMPFSDWTIKGNAGYSYLLPSLNDLYWNPGGNPDLKPEQGWSGELRVVRQLARGKDQNSFRIFEHLSVGSYRRRIENWIIWLPQEHSWIWKPENRLEVTSYGFESRWAGFWKVYGGLFEWNLRYDHTIAKSSKGIEADDPSLGQQLIYVPKHKGNINLSFSIHRLAFFFNYEVSGKRFTTSDNSLWLPAYHIGDLGLSWRPKLFKQQMRLSLAVENLWNARYMIIDNRPMPLRFFRAGINFHFSQKSEN